jgi:hypothetical protein
MLVLAGGVEFLVALLHSAFKLRDASSHAPHGAGQAVSEQQQDNARDDAQFQGTGHTDGENGESHGESSGGNFFEKFSKIPKKFRG